VRFLFTRNQFIEIYVNCPLEICESRDKKGNYVRARAGIIQEYTGISVPFEPPRNPDVIIDSAKETQAEAVERILEHLALKGILSP